jgi:hypothetical protein
MNNIEKKLDAHPLQGLSGMSDNSDAMLSQAKSLGAGDTLKNTASKGELRSGSDINELFGGSTNESL